MPSDAVFQQPAREPPLPEICPDADAAHQSRSIKAVFTSTHSDSDHTARAAEIVQPDWNRRPGRDAGRNPNIDLAQSRESRSLAEPEHFRETRQEPFSIA